MCSNPKGMFYKQYCYLYSFSPSGGQFKPRKQCRGQGLNLSPQCHGFNPNQAPVLLLVKKLTWISDCESPSSTCHSAPNHSPVWLQSQCTRGVLLMEKTSSQNNLTCSAVHWSEIQRVLHHVVVVPYVQEVVPGVIIHSSDILV